MDEYKLNKNNNNIEKKIKNYRINVLYIYICVCKKIWEWGRYEVILYSLFKVIFQKS